MVAHGLVHLCAFFEVYAQCDFFHFNAVQLLREIVLAELTENTLCMVWYGVVLQRRKNLKQNV